MQDIAFNLFRVKMKASPSATSFPNTPLGNPKDSVIILNK